MPERFANAAVQAGKASPNLIKERKLEEIGIRYGELKDVLEEVVQEIDASYDDARLQELVNQAFSAGQAVPESAEAKKANTAQPAESAQPHQPAKSYQEIDALLSDADWKKRYAALQQIQPSPETLPLLAKALKDENTSVRRLATVYLGDIKEPEALPYLFQALKDPSPAVRRTAGDTLSDLGDPAAIGPMAEALRDPNKLVRWRAARFLYEAGDATALPALRAAENDPEFEVRMQVKMALERIEGGREAEGSVWQQMTRRNPTS
jgi:HEAT repeat protein